MKKSNINGCMLQIVALIALALPILFGARHGGRSDGSMGPNNRPAPKEGGCAWIFALLFVSGIAALHLGAQLLVQWGS